MQVAFRFNFRSVAVVNDLVCLEDVVAVVEDNTAGECEGIADPKLIGCVPPNLRPSLRCGLRLSEGKNLLARIIGDGTIVGVVMVAACEGADSDERLIAVVSAFDGGATLVNDCAPSTW
jgi:hypothetical protein